MNIYPCIVDHLKGGNDLSKKKFSKKHETGKTQILPRKTLHADDYEEDEDNYKPLDRQITMAEFFADPDNSDDYAQPKYYAQWDSDNWVVAPTPDQGYNLTMAYIKKPDSITTSDSTTTYLSTYAYDLLLYACLSEAFKYLKGPTNMLDLYERSYQEAVQTFAVEQQGRRRRDEYTSGAIRTLIDAPLPKYK